MRDRVQEGLQTWSYRSDRRRTATRLSASKLIYLLYGVLGVVAVRRRATMSAADLARPLAAGLLAKLAGKVLHKTVLVPRPFVVTGIPPLLDIKPDNGLPSDHALQIGTLLAGAWALQPRAVPAYAVGGVLTLGARLGAGVHHTGDVLTGLGLVAAGAATVRRVRLPAAWHTPLRDYLVPAAPGDTG